MSNPPLEGTRSVGYLILAAVAIVLIVFDVVMWRRKVAGDYGT
jgi:hypothetical protein